MDLKDYIKPEYYGNRELSWMKFNDRVLYEARDKSLPAVGTIEVCEYHVVKSGRIFHDPCRIPEGYGTCQIQEDGHCRHDATEQLEKSF